jgi:hypothetical protein
VLSAGKFSNFKKLFFIFPYFSSLAVFLLLSGEIRLTQESQDQQPKALETTCQPKFPKVFHFPKKALSPHFSPVSGASPKKKNTYRNYHSARARKTFPPSEKKNKKNIFQEKEKLFFGNEKTFA